MLTVFFSCFAKSIVVDVLSAVVNLVCLLTGKNIGCYDLRLSVNVDTVIVPSLVISALFDKLIEGSLCRIDVEYRLEGSSLTLTLSRLVDERSDRR